jgi:hypothetical protein
MRWTEANCKHTLTEFNAKCVNVFDAPALESDVFVGRGDEIHNTVEALQPGTESSCRRVLVIGGLGGISKTQLAITYARRHQRSYPSVFWLSAKSEAALTNSFRAMANRMSLSTTASTLDDE